MICLIQMALLMSSFFHSLHHLDEVGCGQGKHDFGPSGHNFPLWLNSRGHFRLEWIEGHLDECESVH